MVAKHLGLDLLRVLHGKGPGRRHQFALVAEGNPYAWMTSAPSATTIAVPSATNRMVSYPYTKYLVANLPVDMGAAYIMASYETAIALGVPRDRWVFPLSGADCHEHPFVSNRWSFAATPAVELGGRLTLELAGMTIDDIDIATILTPDQVIEALGEAGLKAIPTGVDHGTVTAVSGKIPFEITTWL